MKALISTIRLLFIEVSLGKSDKFLLPKNELTKHQREFVAALNNLLIARPIYLLIYLPFALINEAGGI